MEMENKEEKKNGHGGRRAGAGRKPKTGAKRINVGFLVSEKAAENLKIYAERLGKTRNDVVNEIFEQLGCHEIDKENI